MNLDELKYLWSTHTDAELESRHLSEMQIYELLQQRSNSALGRINRNIKIEMAVVILLGALAMTLLFTRDSTISWIEKIVIPLYVLASGLFYWTKYRALNRSPITTENLNEALRQITQTMGIYMKVYLYAVVFLIPLLGSGGVLYGFYKGRQEHGEGLEGVPMELWLLLVVCMLAYSGLAAWGGKWYINRLYGVHYKELMSCREELSS